MTLSTPTSRLRSLYCVIAGEPEKTVTKLAACVAAIASEYQDAMGDWLGTLPPDADACAVLAILGTTDRLRVVCDDAKTCESIYDGKVHRTSSYILTVDEKETSVRWTRSAVGWVRYPGYRGPGLVTVRPQYYSGYAPSWLQLLLPDAQQYPTFTDAEILRAEKDLKIRIAQRLGLDPLQDARGEWAVVDPANKVLGIYATEEDCHTAIAHETAHTEAAPYGYPVATPSRAVKNLSSQETPLCH